MRYEYLNRAKEYLSVRDYVKASIQLRYAAESGRLTAYEIRWLNDAVESLTLEAVNQ